MISLSYTTDLQSIETTDKTTHTLSNEEKPTRRNLWQPPPRGQWRKSARSALPPPPLYSIEYQLFTTNNSNQQFPHILHAVKTDTTKKDTAMLPEKHRLCPSPCSPDGFASHLSIHQIR